MPFDPSFVLQTIRRAIVGDLGLRPPRPPEGVKVYVSLTTIPPRIANIQRCLDSLVRQTVRPEKIFLCVPERYRRYEAVAQIPEALSRYGDQLQIVRCAEDYGPGTKLMGAQGLVRRDSGALLVLVDDDVTYHDYMLEVFAAEFVARPLQSSSFCVARYKGVDVGHGVDGFAIPAACLAGVEDFYRRIDKLDHVRLVDDLWISYFLRLQGVGIGNLANFVRGRGLIYTVYNDADALIRTHGEFSRANCMRRARQSLHDLFEGKSAAEQGRDAFPGRKAEDVGPGR